MFDAKRDLVFERVVDVPPELVWAAWTTPEHLKQWWTPAPWITTEVEIDLRPGGLFRTVMRAPDGQDSPNVGCYLEIVPHQRLVFTDALEAGYRPASADAHLGFRFTVILTLTPEGSGTRYHARAMHATEAAAARHLEMGFRDGWSAALDQLVAYTKKLGHG